MEAHLKMAPFERMESLKMYENKDPKNGYDVVLPKEWDDTFSFNCTEPYEVHSEK
jgi:hypothetical protein